jgi:integrase
MSQELYQLLMDLKKETGDQKFVLPRFRDWTKGDQARVLRTFCTLAGIPSIKFHTLRACFATQLLQLKVAPVTVQKICGWKDLKTMQRYIRMAGIDEKGATDGLRFLPGQVATPLPPEGTNEVKSEVSQDEKEAIASIVNLFEFKARRNQSA